MYYYTAWQAYSVANEIANAVGAEARLIIDAVGEEVTALVHQLAREYLQQPSTGAGDEREGDDSGPRIVCVSMSHHPGLMRRPRL